MKRPGIFALAFAFAIASGWPATISRAEGDTAVKPLQKRGHRVTRRASYRVGDIAGLDCRPVARHDPPREDDARHCVIGGTIYAIDPATRKVLAIEARIPVPNGI